MAMQSGFIKRIRDIMRMDAGINGDAQRIEQMVWMLFLKVYDTKEDDWELNEDDYVSIIPEECRWRNWAPKDEDGKALTGDPLLDFVNNTLFPTLKELKVTPETPVKKAIVKSTFEDANNYMKDGVHLRQVINIIDEIDFGCGSGRDTKYFLKRNYNVSAIDGSEEICKEASKYTGIKVKQMLFEELNDQNIYDGIWACASILHLSKNDLFRVFHKMNQALKENGIIYTSFKYGEFEGERNGRYFTDFTEDSSKEFILQIPQLQIKEIWTTGDVREGRGDERWLNILICKGKIS